LMQTNATRTANFSLANMVCLLRGTLRTSRTARINTNVVPKIKAVRFRDPPGPCVGFGLER
jgi:hypothetical protein